MSEPIKFVYGYPDFPEAQWKIEKLNLPQECYNALKRTGIDYVGDVMDVVMRFLLDRVAMDGAPRMNSECYATVFCTIGTFENCPKRDEIEEFVRQRFERK